MQSQTKNVNKLASSKREKTVLNMYQDQVSPKTAKTEKTHCMKNVKKNSMKLIELSLLKKHVKKISKASIIIESCC